MSHNTCEYGETLEISAVTAVCAIIKGVKLAERNRNLFFFSHAIDTHWQERVCALTSTLYSQFPPQLKI